MTNWWPDTCDCGFALHGGAVVSVLKKCVLHAELPDDQAFEAAKALNIQSASEQTDEGE